VSRHDKSDIDTVIYRTKETMISLLSWLGLLQALFVAGAADSAAEQQTRDMYTVRSPGTHRKAVEIIDLSNFLLTNSEDGRPKPMIPFYLNVFETREELSEDALQNVEEATSEFLLAELNAVYGTTRDQVSTVNTQIITQERFVEQLYESRKMLQNEREDDSFFGTLRGRNLLRSVPGSKFTMNVNVTFQREPSPRAADVDETLQVAMKDLNYLVQNMTATEDPELGYVFLAYREEISDVREDPAQVDEIQQVLPPQTEGGQSIKFIIPILVAFVFFGVFFALLVVRRRRRRVQEANQKVQEDLAFLDEEHDVFSFENSPTKSSKRALETSDPRDYNDDDGSSYSASQKSAGLASPKYGELASVSAAETVKVSNTRLMPLPSKLTELGSNSLFAFSEEDEDYESSVDGAASQRTPASVHNSEAGVSNESSLSRILNAKSAEEGGSTATPGSPNTANNSTTTAEKEASSPSKTSIASFFSSHFFSGGDSAFAGSQLTARVDNTTEAVKKKAATKNVRSFSLSPKVDKSKSPTSSVQSRSKSEAGGDDDASTDSVFDFLAPDIKGEPSPTKPSSPSKHLNEETQKEVIADMSGNAAKRSTATRAASPSISIKSYNGSTVSEEVKSLDTPQSRTAEVNEEIEGILSDDDSLDFSGAPGSFPRRNRRHARSTTNDGTFNYQTNAMQPQDWSMTDGMSDDDTLSEHNGGVGAFPGGAYRSPPKGAKKKEAGSVRSPPTNQSESSYNPSSPGSKTDSSQASASRQLINDLVWLSKKIAGVKQSAVDSAPGENSVLGPLPTIEPIDSLSYASQDAMLSPTSRPDAPGSPAKQGTPRSANAANTSIVCRDCYAPPGKLNIVIHSTKDGPAVHEVKDDSCLQGSIYPGDLIISVDDIDTRAFTAAQLMKTMAEKSQSERKIAVLHFEEVDSAGKADP